MAHEWKNPTGKLRVCVAEGGSGRGGEQGREVGVFPELSKVLSISDGISSDLVLRLETWCAHYSLVALCVVFTCISPPLSYQIAAQDSLLK